MRGFFIRFMRGLYFLSMLVNEILFLRNFCKEFGWLLKLNIFLSFMYLKVDLKLFIGFLRMVMYLLEFFGKI